MGLPDHYDLDEEVAAVERYQLWPMFPVLPVKRAGGGFDDSNFGVIVATLDGLVLPVRVYKINLFDLKTGPLGPQLEGIEFEEFSTAREMVEAGWIGD